ncbi:potassium channel family protein [Phocicoccus pinnipedialis]|uniref:Ktr system potassium uptake protein A n=1 Tax=Phocicoccus pinnipedialis TaxID=110845 RepID=A0A6V7RH27_9BACL|nr:TrkA family potassium uptake protein [Jeotgalicoccus pinnipedialis]MBP1938987.1 trk system potassium uptake protein TrkA [Jeotgalicoccus pinnipedialis]CAD2077283.1 Ktr system potassium uptake protein A [Jeotgalicoccus pinnipedialis]
MKKEFAVIGLGRFGSSIVQELRELDANVLAIDKNEEVVNEYKDIVTEAVIGNTTDEAVLRSVGITNFDHVIVAIGENIQSSILTTLILKDLGVEKVTVKAQNEYHGRVLEKIGADHVIHPERDIGRLLAHRIVSSHTLDILEISEEHSIVEFKTTKNLYNKSILTLDFREKYDVSILAIKRGNQIIVNPDPVVKLLADDVLILIGKDTDLSRFETRFGTDE